MAGQEKRDKLLDIAERVLLERGFGGTTIEAIAAEAGMTKGWVFHYFQSKREIILAIIDRFEDHLREGRDRLLQTLPDSPSRFLKATVLAMLEYREGTNGKVSNLGGMLDVPEYRERVAELKVRIFNELVTHHPNREEAAMALVIVDGLWMNNQFKIPVYYDGCIQRMEELLLASVDAMGQ